MPRSWTETPGAPWAALFARGMLGLLFFMTGWFKVFSMGPMTHAQRLFVDGYADTWIPVWLLWALGVTIPFLELGGGALLLLGIQVRRVLIALGGLLLLVTYGHLLAEPFFDVTVHVFPRAILVLFLLLIPREVDRWSVEGLFGSRGNGDAGA